MGRAPLLLLILAVLGAGWLLSDTLFDTDAGDAATTEALEAEATILEGVDDVQVDGEGPSLATLGNSRSAADASPLSDSKALAERALGVGPPAATVHFAALVKDRSGQALGDIEVVAIGADGSKRFKTGPDGRFEKTLAAGRYDLLFRGEDVALLRRNFRVDGALTGDTEFTLSDTGVILVTVMRGDEPVPGVTLVASPDGQFGEMLKSTATTGADGAARLESMPAGRYTVTGEVPEGPQLVHKLNLGGGEEENATIRLPQGVQLTGTVRMGKDGPAVANAEIELQVRPAKSAGSLVVQFASGGDGTFDVFVPSGRPVSFVVVAEGYAPFPTQRQRNGVMRALRNLRRTSRPVKYDVILDPGLGIAGVVLDTEDRPVPQVLLDIRRPRMRESLARTMTDDLGRYVFAHLSPDRYDLGILTPGLFPAATEQLRVTLGKEPLEKNIKVLAARRVSGRVVTSTGEGVPAARVWIVGGGIAMRSARDAGRILEAYTSSSGAFLLADLPTDRGLSVRASMGLEEASPVPIAPSDESPAPVRLVIQATGEISGLVVDRETRKPLANVFVDIRPETWDGRTPKSTRTGRDGTFRARAVIPGRWKLTPRLKNYLKHDGDVIDVGVSEVDVQMDLDPGVVFQGLAVTEDGKPLRNANVTVRKVIDGRQTGRWTARSDGAGRFRVSGIERHADYRLVASRSGYRTIVHNGLRTGQNAMRLSFRKRGQ